jgi:hypothetical protein
VYESLLDLKPVIDTSVPRQPRFEFAPGSERRTTGSFYTPPDLVAQLVQHALQPVIDERLATAPTPKEKERAILSICVLDPACGSGHFLLAAARQLARELARVHTDNPSPEDLRNALREVITHCIYGVDRNPLAVELCKLALWMEGHSRGKPLTFLDHRIRCGDSLVGVADLAALHAGIPDAAYDRLKGTRALKQRNRLEREGQLILHNPTDDDLLECALQLEQLSRDPDDTPEQVQQKRQQYAQLRQHAERLRAACDLWTAAFFWDDPTRANAHHGKRRPMPAHSPSRAEPPHARLCRVAGAQGTLLPLVSGVRRCDAGRRVRCDFGQPAVSGRAED